MHNVNYIAIFWKHNSIFSNLRTVGILDTTSIRKIKNYKMFKSIFLND